MKQAALRYAEILEKGAWVTHQEQAEIAKLLRGLAMTEDEAWDELERQQAKKWEAIDMAYRPSGLTLDDDIQEYQKPWVGLTDEEIAQVVGSPLDEVYLADFRKVIAKLKEKNNG